MAPATILEIGQIAGPVVVLGTRKYEKQQHLEGAILFIISEFFTRFRKETCACAAVGC